jgi:cysteine desulfurase/selenocysteine lyase
MNDIKRYAGNAEAFPILKRWDFFNHAGVAPLPHAAAEALRAYAAQAETVAYLHAGWYRDADKLRSLAAGMINADRAEVAFVKNTSEGISIVARGIDWQWGDRVVTTDVEYPANIYPWMEVVRTHGVKLIKVKEEADEQGRRHVPIEKILEAASQKGTRLVTLSHVEYASGQRHDLQRIGEFCRGKGILFCVDAIQSLGILPVDVQAMKIDYLAADGHKWLLGPEGAGIFYCRKDLIDHTRPLMIGWMNVVDAQNYGNYDYTLKSDATRFECGSLNIAGLLALKASVELLTSVPPGSVSAQMFELTNYLIEGLEAKGYRVLSPREKWQWSGIVSFTSPTHNHEHIFRTLRKEHHTELAVREGRLRCSPHFYNTAEQLDRLVARLPGH